LPFAVEISANAVATAAATAVGAAAAI